MRGLNKKRIVGHRRSMIMNVDDIMDYLKEKGYKNIDYKGVAYKLTGTDKETLDKYIKYIQRIGRQY